MQGGRSHRGGGGMVEAASETGHRYCCQSARVIGRQRKADEAERIDRQAASEIGLFDERLV